MDMGNFLSAKLGLLIDELGFILVYFGRQVLIPLR